MHRSPLLCRPLSGMCLKRGAPYCLGGNPSGFLGGKTLETPPVRYLLLCFCLFCISVSFADDKFACLSTLMEIRVQTLEKSRLRNCDRGIAGSIAMRRSDVNDVPAGSRWVILREASLRLGTFGDVSVYTLVIK